MNDFFIQNMISVFATALGTTGLAGWFFERRKRKAQVRQINVDTDADAIKNVSSIIDIYKQELDNLRARNKKHFEELTKLYEEKIKLLNDEIRLLKRTINQHKKESAALRRQLKEKL